MASIIRFSAYRPLAATNIRTTYSIASHIPQDTSDYIDEPRPLPSFSFKKYAPDLEPQGGIPPLFDKIYEGTLSREIMQKRYQLLGKEKWREFIDGKDAAHGKHAYDMGFHREGLGEKEPGYLKGMTETIEYIHETIDEKLTIENYLRIHSIACQHFERDDADDFTICRKEEVGAFRTIRVGSLIYPKRRIEKTVLKELHHLNRRIQASQFIEKNGNHISLSYIENENPEQMRNKFSKLLDGYHRDIERCIEPSQKLYVIARLFQHSQWLHTTTDGSGRLDIAVMNKLLTQNGFHPTILDQPYMCCTNTLAEWIESLQDGLQLWHSTALKIHGYIH